MNSTPDVLPAWATEEIVIEEYNPVWPLMASILIRELKTLHTFEDARFEHIGSTAVPDLAGKPVIDILLPVNDFDDLDTIVVALQPENWNLIPPELAVKDDHRTFVKVVKEKRAAHFHLINNERDIKRHIAFRDALRQNPELANEYAKLKTELAETYKNDREGYTGAKTDFVNRVVEV